MNDHPARRLWVALETLHCVVYFSPKVREVGTALGLRGFWSTYFAFRAAPLGYVDAEPVIASFAGFEPGMVAKALPDAWTRTTPGACLAARKQLSTDELRQIGVDEEACGAVVGILAPLVARADPTGRSLFAANSVLALGEDPIGAMWQIATSLREHRGDGHVAALVAGGLSGLEAHVLQVGVGRFPAETILGVRGWSESDWERAVGNLRERGLVEDSPTIDLTEMGRACLYEIESATDNAAWLGALEPLAEDGVAQVLGLLESSVAAVRASEILPAVNPTGLTDG